VAPPCRKLVELDGVPPPPNDNIAIAVAGIGSRTKGGVSATMYEDGPEKLGYPAARTYRFSYRGVGGPNFHEPYDPVDTFGDLRVAAGRLRELLERIAAAHPGVAVDVIAHSQGGIVARRALEKLLEEWSPGLPRVEHFITFSTPHEGAPAAAAIKEFKSGLLGKVVTAAIQRVAGDRLPDPSSIAVAQLEPDSPLIEDIAGEDVSYGTRFLALATAQDPVVTADVALPDGAVGRVVSLPLGRWVMAHDAVVASPSARAIAYDFLRDAPESCKTTSDSLGPDIGRALGWAERTLGRVGRIVESRIGL
jgi:pimeloyl-ACP methyl ester carboxylesterase